MSHTFQLSEEQYAYLLAYAKGIGETPEAIFEYWVDGKIDRMEAGRKWKEEQTRKSHKEGSLDLSTQIPEAGISISTSKKEVDI